MKEEGKGKRTPMNSFTWRFWRRCSSSRFSACVSLEGFVSGCCSEAGVRIERIVPVHCDMCRVCGGREVGIGPG